MIVGDEREIYLTTEDVAAFDKMCESYADIFKELQELCEGCMYYEESSAKSYGQNLRIHKNDIYKVKSRPQKVQRVYRRWHNDYTYRFA